MDCPFYKRNANVTLLIRGECFRIGGQNSRRSCQSEECIDNQIKCIKSVHEFIIQPLLSYGFKCNVHLHTYDVPLIDTYLSFFSNLDVSFHFENKSKENQSTMWEKSIQYSINNFNPDYILAIRPDMMFHSHFIHNIQFDKFNHAFRIANHFGLRNTHITPKKNTRISDTLQWIPSSFFNIAHIFPGHEYYDVLPHMEKNSVYISLLFADTDSSKCQNPIYILPQRKLSRFLPRDFLI